MKYISMSTTKPVRAGSEDLIQLLNEFHAKPQSWSTCLLTSLNDILRQVKARQPSAYFVFHGHQECMNLSPLKKWPQTNGWTFNCWLSVSDYGTLQNAHTLYNFQTKDGLGFSAHLESQSLVITTTRQQGKSLQHRTPLKFEDDKWHMLTIVYIYNRWGRGELRLYMDSLSISTVSLQWYLGPKCQFTHCSIGGSLPSSNTMAAFCGSLTNLMGFSTSLFEDQIDAIYALGVEYEGQFRFDNEYDHDLSENHRRLLFANGQLYHSLMFAYSPSSCDRNLCPNRAPKSSEFFAHSSHAILCGDIESVVNCSVHGTLHSFGGLQALYPLLESFDIPVVKSIERSEEHTEPIAVLFLDLVINLVHMSPQMGRQLIQSKGLLLFACTLRKADPAHLTEALLDRLMIFARELVNVADQASSGVFECRPQIHSSLTRKLLRHLHSYLLFNPDVWIRASVQIQDQLYQFLATEFLPSLVRLGCVNRSTTVLQAMYTLKFYYSLSDSQKRSGFKLKTPGSLPVGDRMDVLKLRANLLVYIRHTVLRYNTMLDLEMQAILNYLWTVQEDENLHDVLHMLTSLIMKHSEAVGAEFVRNDGLYIVFKLINSEDECNRIYALKLLGAYLYEAQVIKHDDTINRYHLFNLLTDRLSQFDKPLSVLLYNTLIELLVGQLDPNLQATPISALTPNSLIINPGIIRVISNLIHHSEVSAETRMIREAFLRHLIALCSTDDRNCRALLQISIWQVFLMQLTYFYPSCEYESVNLACSLRLLRTLVFYAIRHVEDGWRVWIDTQALLHLWLFRAQAQNPQLCTEPTGGDMASTIPSSNLTEANNEHVTEQLPSHPSSEATTSSVDDTVGKVNVPDSNADDEEASMRKSNLFGWSYVHQLLFDDLLYTIEEELSIVAADHITYNEGTTLRSMNAPAHAERGSGSNNADLLAFVGLSVDASDSGQIEHQALRTLRDPINRIFALNLINVLSDCVDLFLTACGGLLPLLALATTTTGEVGAFETVNGLSKSDAISYSLRLAYLADLCITNIDLRQVEKRRSMTPGVLLRQLTRLYLFTAVRNCLESRFLRLQPSHELALHMKSFSSLADNVRFVELDASPSSSVRFGIDPDSKNDHSHIVEGSIPRNDDDQLKISRPIHGLLNATIEMELESMSLRLLCITHVQSQQASGDEVRLGITPLPWRFMKFLTSNQLHLLNTLKFKQQMKTRHLSKKLQHLILSLHPTMRYPVIFDKHFIDAAIQPLIDPTALLQVRDLNRLKAVIYKSEDLSRGSESLAMAIAYFISVLLISKYRDILEPTLDLCTPQPLPKNEPIGNSEISPPTPSSRIPNTSHSKASENSVTSQPNFTSPDSTIPDDIETNAISVNIAQPLETKPRHDEHITDTLNSCLGPAVSFLQELFSDFYNHFSKELVGSHGQSLLATGLANLRNQEPVIELVMLMCSQEWQTSLQKNAGLAFIELINEGRVFSANVRDHITRVGNEAVTFMTRLRTTEIPFHSEFSQLCAQVSAQHREDARLFDGLIETARYHDQISGSCIHDGIHRMLDHLWANRFGCIDVTRVEDEPLTFFHLDSWEDDSRRRRRLTPNPSGSRHLDAILYSPNQTDLTAPPSNDSLLVNVLLKDSNAAMVVVEPSLDTTSIDSSTSVSEVVSDPTVATEADSSSVCLDDFRKQYMDSLEAVNLFLDVADAIVYSLPCTLISHGMCVHGNLSVADVFIQFERDPQHSSNQRLPHDILVNLEASRQCWYFQEIHAIFTRRHLHRPIALELFVNFRNSVLFAFTDRSSVERLIDSLPPVGVGSKYGLPRTRTTSLSSPFQLFAKSNMTVRWQRREVSNFDYLMYLNTISGRTYNDLNQYPIFPWVLSNYSSDQLDLNESSNYRDLSKPIGAIIPERKAYFDERFETWEDDSQPPFHYGTHYSTAAFVLTYLIRLEPFTTLFLHLQDGKFDHPDRTFFSVGRTWDNCQRNSSDVKELVPEFFYLSEMFENPNQLNLGQTEKGEDIGNVTLPPWAASPEDFVRIHRQALESDLVSCQLHHWIDLIFGYKQRGPEAVRATNVFHHLTYDGNVDWSKITDPVLLQAVEDQIQSFGQTPAQLMHTPHPHRNSNLHMDPLCFAPLIDEVCMMYKFYSNAAVVYLTINTNSTNLSYPALVSINANRAIVVSRWNNMLADNSYKGARLSLNRSVSISSPTSNARFESLDAAIVSPKTREASSPEVKLSNVASDDPGASKNSTPNTPATPSYKSATSNIVSYRVSEEVYSPHSPLPCTHCLGDDFDPVLPARSSQFIVSSDNRLVIACGYADCSFRLFCLETGRVLQSIFGHFQVVTCISHSEWHLSDHWVYLVSGSRDCTVKLWLFDSQQSAVVDGEGSTSLCPLVTLVGHEAELTALDISAELGLVVSGSKGGTCLMHTTHGVLLRQLHINVPDLGSSAHPIFNAPIRSLSIHREGYLIVRIGTTGLSLYTLNGKLIRSSNLAQLGAVNQYDLSAVIFSACGRYVLVGGTDGVVWVLRSHSLIPVHTFPRCEYPIHSLVLTTDQKFLLAGLSSGAVMIFYIDFRRWHHEFQERYSPLPPPLT